MHQLEECLPQGFLGGYIKGFNLEEVYGPGDCNNVYTYGETSDSIILYWVNTHNQTECLSKLKIMV